jgi:hypothetical protein
MAMNGIPPIIPPLQGFDEFQRETELELAGAPRFRLTRFGTIKPDITAQYLVKGSGLAVIWGAPKCGKSFWTFDLLMHVTLDRPYRGRRVMAGVVVYCALEGAQGFKNRIEAFRRARMAEADDRNPPFYLMATPLSLVRDQKSFIAEIRQQLGEQKPVAVCIDTLNRSLDGSESSDEDMTAYVRAADAIRDAFGCLVVIVHHCGHNGDRPRGHSSLMGALDVQIAVRRDATDNIVAELELSKDGETGLQFVSRLKVVEIGSDQDGDPITSCVIEALDAPAAAARVPAKGRMSDIEMIKRAIVDAYGRLTDRVEPSPGFDGALVRKVPVDKLRGEIKSRGFLETDDDDKLTSTARSNFRRAKTDLIAAKRFIEADKQFWRLFESRSESQPERTPF